MKSLQGTKTTISGKIADQQFKRPFEEEKREEEEEEQHAGMPVFVFNHSTSLYTTACMSSMLRWVETSHNSTGLPMINIEETGLVSVLRMNLQSWVRCRGMPAF